MSSFSPTLASKLPVWSTIGACYVAVARNLDQLARISWLWLLVMILVYAAVHWLVWRWTSQGGLVTKIIVAMLPPNLFIEVPFLASIAVAWHRFILCQERVTRLVYLRLDRTVWLYALYSFLFLLLMLAPLYFVMPLLLLGIAALDEAVLLWAVLFLSLAFLVMPRFSLVLPAAALGERLSLRQARRSTRGNTLRLALATGLCTLPAALLFKLPPILLVSLEQRWIPGADPQVVYVIGQLLDSIGYAVLNSVGYAVLTILTVTLLSLTYRLFAVPRDEKPTVPSPEVMP